MYALYKSSTSNNQMFHVKHFEKIKFAVLSAHRGERGKIMSFAQKYNKGSVIFDIDIKDYVFTDGYDFVKNHGSNVVKIDGLYINNKGMYDDHPVAIIKSEKLLVDLPSHMTDTVREILKDSESITLIKKGLVGIKAHEYVDKKYKKNCVGFEWCDL